MNLVKELHGSKIAKYFELRDNNTAPNLSVFRVCFTGKKSGLEQKFNVNTEMIGEVNPCLLEPISNPKLTKNQYGELTVYIEINYSNLRELEHANAYFQLNPNSVQFYKIKEEHLSPISFL